MSTSRKTNRTTVYIEPQELYDEVKTYRDAVQLDPEAA